MKHTLTSILCLVLIGCLLCPMALAEQSAEAQAQLEHELGAFEITAIQRELAKTNTAGYTVLDAGRGNPNWINTQARYAFIRLMEFALSESERTMQQPSMAGQAHADGIGARFDAEMDPADDTDAFLLRAVAYCTDTLQLDKDTLLKQLVDGIIGDYYPTPSRCLTSIEPILNAYLASTLFGDAIPETTTQIFPTEGGSAAICYIFNALNHNRILRPGDQIAIATPIFTPYLQIPDVNAYSLLPVDVSSTEENNWDIPDESLEKLADPAVKAFFLVNPSNPASHAMSQATIDKLVKVVERNPDLIIITDDVYGTFVNGFQTLYARLPYNTILVYSFSKLYGVTGWRIGMIAMNERNVFDKLLTELPETDKQFLHKEYSIVTDEPESLPFIERMVADSRSIGLYHTSGLSTPQQVFMALLALTHLTSGEEDAYIRLANSIVHDRYAALMDALGLTPDESAENAQYYALIDVQSVATGHYGDAFAAWMADTVDDLTFLNDLAENVGVVLMYGPGFDAPQGMVRISLANLNKEDYVEIGRRIFELMDTYFEQFQAADAA